LVRRPAQSAASGVLKYTFQFLTKSGIDAGEVTREHHAERNLTDARPGWAA